MKLSVNADFDFASARRMFRRHGLYLRRSANGSIFIHLRPGTSINAVAEGLNELITNFDNASDYASNVEK